jgi:hypothetical protein
LCGPASSSQNLICRVERIRDVHAFPTKGIFAWSSPEGNPNSYACSQQQISVDEPIDMVNCSARLQLPVLSSFTAETETEKTQKDQGCHCAADSFPDVI